MSRAAAGPWSHFLKNCLFSNVRILRGKWCHFYHLRALRQIKPPSFHRPSPLSHFKTLQERLHRCKNLSYSSSALVAGIQDEGWYSVMSKWEWGSLLWLHVKVTSKGLLLNYLVKSQSTFFCSLFFKTLKLQWLGNPFLWKALFACLVWLEKCQRLYLQTHEHQDTQEQVYAALSMSMAVLGHLGFIPRRAFIYCLLSWRVGEGNGTPLQYSYLENPRDGGAW